MSVSGHLLMTNNAVLHPPQAPTVSVIIPAYNTADYIGETLESVLSQSFSDFEVIVINDGSPDTERLEKSIKPFESRIIYLKRDNGGPSAARNMGLRQARGEYVAFLDSDDVWFTDYLRSQMQVLRQNPGLDLVYTDILLFGDSPFAGKSYMELHPPKGAATFESVLVEDCKIPTSGTVARRQALIDAGLFDERFVRSEDYDLWLRVAHRGGRIAYQRKVLARHRIHAESLAANGEKLLAAELDVVTKLTRTLDLTAWERSLAEHRIARAEAYLQLARGKASLLAGEDKEARVSLSKANSFLRSPRLTAVLLVLRCSPRLARFMATVWQKILARQATLPSVV
jgi:glycosyltransferase involved in cell wall biosynthesis